MPLQSVGDYWLKIGLRHKTSMAETETRRWYVWRPRRQNRDHNPGHTALRKNM